MGVVLAAVLSHPLVAVAQVPNPGPAIAAAKDAKAQTEAAQKKNSDALDPQSAPAAGPASPQRPQGAEAAGDQKPAQGPGYSYDPQGRRDPFVSLLGRGGDLPGGTGARPSGLPGLLINEVTLKGVLKSTKGDFIALLQAPDSRTYIVRAGDKVMDGKVKAISQDAVVFSQDVNDPLSLVKQREVRKTIRPEAR
ncbi:MAG TPA: hypothetical protein VL225_20780 [Vicinamibacterales bacterium]|nr:hypothetical protein [Vicinamibacterales bacterium]